jgi:hypothetical protein
LWVNVAEDRRDMDWCYKVKFKPNSEGRMLPRDVLHSSEGVEIEALYAKGWTLIYSGSDLFFKMSATRDLRNIPKEQWPLEISERKFCIGPDCSVYVDVRTLSREVSADELPRIANHIKSALCAHWKIPYSEAPKVERVEFRDALFSKFSG